MSTRDKHFNVEAYLKQMAPKESIDFFGVEIATPTDTPLSYTLRAKEIQEQSADDTSGVLTLLADILGEDVAAAIEERDPGIRAIGALLLWAFSNSSGDDIDFPTAFERYLEQEKESKEAASKGDEDGESTEEDNEEEEGKSSSSAKVASLPNREARRTAARASGKKSVSTSR